MTATEQPNESSGGSAPPTRSSLSGVPSAAPSRDSSGAPVARTADAAARKAENVRTPDELTADEVRGPQHESVDVVNPTERTGAGETVNRPTQPDARPSPTRSCRPVSATT